MKDLLASVFRLFKKEEKPAPTVTEDFEPRPAVEPWPFPAETKKRKAPAKKTVAKKTPAKKTPAKKTTKAKK